MNTLALALIMIVGFSVGELMKANVVWRKCSDSEEDEVEAIYKQYLYSVRRSITYMGMNDMVCVRTESYPLRTASVFTGVYQNNSLVTQCDYKYLDNYTPQFTFTNCIAVNKK